MNPALLIGHVINLRNPVFIDQSTLISSYMSHQTKTFYCKHTTLLYILAHFVHDILFKIED